MKRAYVVSGSTHPDSARNKMFNVLDHTVLFTIAGSRSYGLHNEYSDVDVKGIFIPPIREARFGILEGHEQVDSRRHLAPFYNLLTEEEKRATVLDCVDKGGDITSPDGVVYDIIKFFKLALNANPNILEVLFCEDKDIRLITPAGQIIRDNRDLFLSKKVVWSYSGYAFSQMKRIRSHRSWLLSPPQAPPTREQFGLPKDRSTISGDEQNAFLWVIAELLKDKVGEFRLSRATREELEEKVDLFGAIQSDVPDHVWPVLQEMTGATSEFIQAMQAERKYKAAVNHWKSYQNWKKTRNPKRAAIEKKCNFDGKHGLHLARLMLQGHGILEKNTLTVKLPSDLREWLMQIREGNMPFEELEDWFEKEQENLKLAAEQSALPDKPDRTKANELLIQLQEEAFRSQ